MRWDGCSFVGRLRDCSAATCIRTDVELQKLSFEDMVLVHTVHEIRM